MVRDGNHLYHREWLGPSDMLALGNEYQLMHRLGQVAQGSYIRLET